MLTDEGEVEDERVDTGTLTRAAPTTTTVSRRTRTEEK